MRYFRTIRSRASALLIGALLALAVPAVAQFGGSPSRARIGCSLGIATSASTTCGNISITGTAPTLEVDESDAAANQGTTQHLWEGGQYTIRSRTDAGGVGADLFVATRSGTSWLNSTLRGTSINLTTGTSNYVADSTGHTFTGDLFGNGASLGVGEDMTIAGFLRANNGTATNPTYSWSGDTNTGMFWNGVADQIAWTTGGNNRLRLTTTQVQIGDGGVNNATITTANGNATFAALTVNSCSGCLTGLGAAFGGYTDSAATAENVPTGWSVSLTGSTFTWTHNLGVSPSTDLAITVTPQVGSSEACRVNAIATNSFDTICYTTSTGSAANVAHFITAVTVAN